MSNNNSGFISPKAKIHDTTFIGNNVRIFGATTIGPNCFIDDNVVVGYPSKNTLKKMVKGGNVPTNLFELDNFSEGETVLSERCCVRFGSVISFGTYLHENVYCDSGTQIGSFCKIGISSQILYGAKIYNNVSIGADCRIGGFCCDRSKIENNVSMFGELVHSYRVPIGGLKEQSPIIRYGATVGWHAIVIGGIEIGEHSYVAAGAVVSKNVEANAVVVGPASEVIPFSEWKGSLGKDQNFSDSVGNIENV